MPEEHNILILFAILMSGDFFPFFLSFTTPSYIYTRGYIYARREIYREGEKEGKEEKEDISY